MGLNQFERIDEMLLRVQAQYRLSLVPWKDFTIFFAEQIATMLLGDNQELVTFVCCLEFMLGSEHFSSWGSDIISFPSLDIDRIFKPNTKSLCHFIAIIKKYAENIETRNYLLHEHSGYYKETLNDFENFIAALENYNKNKP